MADMDYRSRLDDWHLQLSILVRALRPVLDAVEDDDLGAVGHVLQERLQHAVESCPFPPAGEGEVAAEPLPSLLAGVLDQVMHS